MKYKTNYAKDECKGDFDIQIKEEGEYGVIVRKVQDPFKLNEEKYIVFVEVSAFCYNNKKFDMLKRAPSLSFLWDNKKEDFADHIGGKARWMEFVEAINIDKDDAVDSEAFKESILVIEYRNKKLNSGESKMIAVKSMEATDKIFEMAVGFIK